MSPEHMSKQTMQSSQPSHPCSNWPIKSPTIPTADRLHSPCPWSLPLPPEAQSYNSRVSIWSFSSTPHKCLYCHCQSNSESNASFIVGAWQWEQCTFFAKNLVVTMVTITTAINMNNWSELIEYLLSKKSDLDTTVKWTSLDKVCY